MASSSTIPPALQYAAARNWQRMLSSARANPSDLLAVEEESGFTVLHRAVAGAAPDDVVRDLVTTSKEGQQATLVRCREGSWTPLHLSCRAISTDDTILAIALSNPAAISVQDDDGDNALHCALRNGASDMVLQTLIDLGGASSSCTSSASVDRLTSSDTANNIFQTADYGDGDWPIHAAIRHEAPTHIVELLLDASPESIDARNCEWKAPLHLACEFERHDVVALLIQRIMRMTGRPDGFRSYLATEDYYGSTPVGCLWERYLDICATEGDNDDNNVCLDLCETVEQIEVWESIVLLITSAYYGLEVDFDPRCRSRSQVQLLIQAVIGLGSICPPSLLDLLVKRYPLVLSTPDSCGRLPLHDAIFQAAETSSSGGRRKCSSPHAPRPGALNTIGSASINNSAIMPSESASALKVPKQDREDDALSPNQLLRQEGLLHSSHADGLTTSLEVIINAYPQAATQQDPEGHLPLSLAALCGLPWKQGTECLFKASPKAVRVQDEKTGLFPFMLAATADSTNETHQVDTIFQLLRQEPALVSSGVSESRISRGKKRRADSDSYDRNHKKKKL